MWVYTHLVEKNNHKVNVVDENLEAFRIHRLHLHVLVGRVLVLEEELKDLLLVGEVPGVEDGGEVAEKGEGGQPPQRIVLGQRVVDNPDKPTTTTTREGGGRVSLVH